MKMITLKYIGAEPTLVRETYTSEKREVKKGETFKCEERLAKNYLRSYGSLFVDLGGGESKESADKKVAKAEKREKKQKKVESKESEDE